MSVEFESPLDIRRAVAGRARAARLAANLTQDGLAQRSGVSLGTLKRFERSGAASLEVVVRIALALRMESGFAALFQPPRFASLDEVMAMPKVSDPVDVGAIEHAYGATAREAGVDMPETTLFPAKHGPGYFGARRFDRRSNERLHMHTVSGLLNVDHTLPSLGYAGMIKAVRQLTRRQADVDQAFTRMVFNVVARNRDDHTKNHGFLMAEDGAWSISPAYDVTFSSGPGGEHALDVHGEGQNPGPDHILAVAKEAGVAKKTAVAVIDRIREAVDRWPAFASNTSVSSRMATSIDRLLNGVRPRRRVASSGSRKT